MSDYQDLSEAIDSGLRAVKKYQFQVICYLTLQRGMKAKKSEICEYMVKVNRGAKKENGKLIDFRHYMSCPVWIALGKTKSIIRIDNGLVSLTANMTSDQRDKISKKCKGIYQN